MARLATQVAPGINTYVTNLRVNFDSMRVLWTKYSISMSSMVGSPLSRSPTSMICSTRMTLRCKTTKLLLDTIVKEFNMSRKLDDFVFCGRRVRVTPEALIVSQELATSSLAPMELCRTQRPPETMLTYSEHREYRSLLVKLQWLHLHSRPDLSYEVNRAAHRSSAPTVADARALNAISLKAQRSSETTLRYPRGVINVSSAQLVTYGDARFCPLVKKTS